MSYKLQKSSLSTPTIVDTALKISSTARSDVPKDGFGPHVQVASAVVRNQIAHDGEVASYLKMREIETDYN